MQGTRDEHRQRQAQHQVNPVRPNHDHGDPLSAVRLWTAGRMPAYSFIRPENRWGSGELTAISAGAESGSAKIKCRVKPLISEHFLSEGRDAMTTTVSAPTTTGPERERVRRLVRAPRGPERTCKGWIQEAALRMLMNNLDPEVAEDPDRLVVYGGSRKAARTWVAFDQIVATLGKLDNDETLLVQSGKPVGVIRTHELAPRVIIANSLLVPKWATWEEFRRLEAMGLTMYGQMTAGSWIYIGTQG